MTDKLKRIVKSEMEKLPAESRNAISSVDWAAISEEIGGSYFSAEESINDFQAEVLTVLLGLDDPALFRVHIENNLGATTEESEAITREVFEKIFIPISLRLREHMKRSDKVTTASWQKNLDFILSGGDFSVYADRPIAEDEEGKL